VPKVDKMMNTIASLGIGAIIALYTYGLRAGWNMPLSSNPRTTFIAFVIFGMAACGVGIGHSVETVGWGNPLVILGMGFGLVNLIIAYVGFTGGQVWFVHDYFSAMTAMGGVMLLKVLVKLTMNLVYL